VYSAIIKLHRSTMYVDATYCYWRSRVVWTSGLSWSWALQKPLNWSSCRLGCGFGWAQGEGKGEPL